MNNKNFRPSKLFTSICLSLLSVQVSAQSLPERVPAVELKTPTQEVQAPVAAKPQTLPLDSEVPVRQELSSDKVEKGASKSDSSGPSVSPVESKKLESVNIPDNQKNALKANSSTGSASPVELKKLNSNKSVTQKSTSIKANTSAELKAQSSDKINKEESKEEKPLTYELGKNKVKSNIDVERFDDDEYKYSDPNDKSKQILGTDGSKPSIRSNFIRGGLIEKGGATSESIQYRYIARGGWLIERFQPYLDRIAIEVRKADSSDLWSSYTELTRTFSYMCLLIATDDNSKKMEHAVAKSIAIHREALSKLRLQWDKKPENVALLFEEYMQSTFYEDLNRDAIKIPAGSFAGGQYKSLNDTYPDEAPSEASSPFNALKELTKKKK